MRIDENNSWQMYVDFWDWLRCHPIWITNLFLAYVNYLITTEKIKRHQ